MANLPDGAASVWAVATRISQLDPNGYVVPGANVFVTNTLVKATLTPVVETGDEVVVKGASGDGLVYAKHGDWIKYYTVALDLATPDPDLEQILAGGVVLNSSATALGAPTGLTVGPQITLGQLAAGTYGYRASLYNAYGETLAGAEVTAVVASGTAGLNVISGVVIPAGAIGARVYGRTQGLEAFLGVIPNIGTQATSAASGTGAVSSLTVTPLTQGIPQGTTFQITGDTNSPKIVFTTTAYAAAGAVALPVSPSQAVTTTIAAGALVPVFVDTGAAIPSGSMATADQTAGPGHVGYQAPALGAVAQPNGVSLEFYARAVKGGYQVGTQPFYRHVWPRVTGLHQMPREVTNANMASTFDGQAFENPNWGSGPFGDWQFDSSKVFQRARCGSAMVPAPGYTSVPATV